MKNTVIASVFQDIADLLELKGENKFKVRAYQRAARTIEHLPKEIEVMLAEYDDLKDIHAQRAHELGVKLVLGTDAHSSVQLGFMRFGIGVARRGWCQPEHILNTRPVEEVLTFLRRD